VLKHPGRAPLIKLALGLLLLAGCASHAPPGTIYAVETRANEAYGPLPAERGDLYVPKGTATRPPVVVVIHGGGWVSGNRIADAAFAKLLAIHGIAAFNIDYRLADAANPSTRWPAQLVDAQLAVRWVRAHAREFGVDGTRVGAAGDSSGGHLAEMLGVTKQSVPGDQSALWPDQSPAVSAVAEQFAPVDLATMPPWVMGCYPPLFGTQTPTPDMLASMSPLPGITGRSAPTLIIQGTADVIVPPAQSERLQGVLRLAGVPVELVRFSGGHGYEGIDANAVFALQSRMVTWLGGQLGTR
jgi:acetyl esterase/lipase